MGQVNASGFRAVSPMRWVLDADGRNLCVRYERVEASGRWAVLVDGERRAACRDLAEAQGEALRLAGT